jgi:uncharacterized membrane protein
MNLAQDLLPNSWLISGYLLYGVVLSLALWRIDYQNLLRVPQRQHLFFGASIAIMCLWLIRAGITPGLGVHLLGITSLTLLLGWQLAVVGAVAALAGSAIMGNEEWLSLGLSGVLLVLIPVLVTHAVWRFTLRFLPPNLFIYILGCGFFGAGIATMAARLSVGGVLFAGGVLDWNTTGTEYLPISLLTLFPESFINGIVIAAIAAYRPEWLATLDAERFLGEG